MLAMLTLYGVGPPANAVVIAQRMQEACPDLFVYGARLANSSCGRSIVDSYVAAVLAAEQADHKARQDAMHKAVDEQAAVAGAQDAQEVDAEAGGDAAPAAEAAPAGRSRHLLQQARGVSFSGSLTATPVRGPREHMAPLWSATTTLTASMPRGGISGHTVSIKKRRHSTRHHHHQLHGEDGNDSDSSNGVVAAVGGATDGPAIVASGGAVEDTASSSAMSTFVQHSHHSLRVRQQPEVRTC